MKLSRLNPFKGLPNAKEVWAWGMYDLANQSFTLLIITLLFPIYFKNVIAPANGDALWATAGSGSLALVVLLSPFVGAAADSYGIKKRLLIITGVICCVLTCLMALLGANDTALAIGLFVAANVSYQLGENILAGFLPEVSTPRNIGRVSATGWAMGYIGALLLILLTLVGMLVIGWKDESQWAPYFLLAGVWFALGMIAPWKILKEVRPTTKAQGTLVANTIGRLTETVRQASRYRHLSRFLLAFFIYGLGVQTIIYFAGIIARDFGLQDAQLMVFTLQLTVMAGAAAIVTGIYQERVGAKATLIFYLLLWIVTALGLLALTLIPAGQRTDNQWAFWVVGNGVGLGLGGIGTASRSMVGRFAPRHKTAEFFGLWGMTYKSAGVVGVLSFGVVKSWLGDPASMVLLGSFFVIGLVLLLRVNETSGVRAARRAERDAARTQAP